MKTARPGRREELLDAIAREEGRVAQLESEQADVRSRLAALRAEVALFGAEPEIRVRLAVAAEAPVPYTSAEKLDALLCEYGVSIEVHDERIGGEPIGYRFRGKLTPVQQKAASALLGHDIGVFVAPPGVGKTVVGTYLVAERGCSTLILVHRRPLLDQWLAQLSLFLGIEPKEIGQIGAGKKTGNGRLDVAMIQSLVRKDKVEDVVANYG